MRQGKLMFLILPMLFLTGCASSIKYSMKKGIYQGNKVSLGRRAVIDIFEDTRTTLERDGAMRKVFGTEVTCTKDRNFKPNINTQISSILAEHLKKSNIFTAVTVREVDNNLENNANEMDKLKAEGIDLVILGDLKHFYGYQSFSAAPQAETLLGSTGPIIEAIVNPKQVGGNVEYKNVKIIDLAAGKVLWQGNITYTFDEKDIIYYGQVKYSLRALKEANNKFARKIDEVINGRTTEALQLKEEAVPPEAIPEN